jgi:hypothetical protein
MDSKQTKKAQNPLLQLVRFVALNLKILKLTKH